MRRAVTPLLLKMAVLATGIAASLLPADARAEGLRDASLEEAANMVARAGSTRINCPRMAPPKLSIIIKNEDVVLDHSRDLAFLKANSGTSHALHAEVLGLSVSTIEAVRSINFVFDYPDRGPGLCATVEDMEIVLGVSNRVIYIAREVQQSQCLKTFVKTHEYKHVGVDEAVIRRWIPEWRAEMTRALRDVHKHRGYGSANQLQAAMEARIRSSFDKVFAAMKLDRARMQADIDQGGDYERVTKVCDGVANRILRHSQDTARN